VQADAESVPASLKEAASARCEPPTTEHVQAGWCVTRDGVRCERGGEDDTG
jgi:hypothetical protein